MHHQNGWIKEYKNGTRLAGTDEDVMSGRASWSRSSLTDMVALHLCQDNQVFSLRLPDNSVTDFWQSDDYEAIPGSEPIMVLRRIQMRKEIPTLPDGKMRAFWYTIEVDLKTARVREFLLDNKI